VTQVEKLVETLFGSYPLQKFCLEICPSQGSYFIKEY